MRGMCGLLSDVVGAGGCPREAGHDGECFWFIPWELAGPDDWRVIVYSGTAANRVRRCRGRFTAMPELTDVHQLLLTLSTYRHREQQKRQWRLTHPVPLVAPDPEPVPTVVRERPWPVDPSTVESAASRAARALARSVTHG